jgi:hypothetical protein
MVMFTAVYVQRKPVTGVILTPQVTVTVVTDMYVIAVQGHRQ